MKVGLIFGCFDLFHIGHLNILSKAKENCDYLIVGVCNDKHIKDRKNKQPYFNENDRLEIIKSIRYVDEAFLIYGDLKDYKEFIDERIDIIFAGSDHINEEQFSLFESQEIKFFPYTKGISSTIIAGKINE